MENVELKRLLDENTQYREDLFIRGFLLTNQKNLNLGEFPFYGNWKKEEHAGYVFLAHKLTGMYFYETDDKKCFFLFGHAYDPFSMEINEVKILQSLSEVYGEDGYIDKINGLTGIYVLGVIIDGKIEYLNDAAGIQSASTGIVDGNFYLTSHAQLVGDILNLKMDSFVKKLVNYKWYGRLLGPYLPGDLSPFHELKRVVNSMIYTYDGTISHKRFWPLESFDTVYGDEYELMISGASEIMKNNLELISRKWKNPWISLTGGIDSNTTFAAANNIYDRFNTFSYISAEKETIDASAAAKIADRFNIKHHVFNIPDKNNEIENFNVILEVLRHNNGYVADLKDNEARKRMYLRQNASCDVEVKSWVSETIRAYWYKYFGRKKMPGMSPKLFRNLYKIFISDRKLAHEIDSLFEKYIKEYEYDKIPESYPIADIHYNEVSWGSWGSINISEMKYCFDITIAYNNRKFLDLMFKAPLDKRISDQHHLDVKRVLNPELYDMNIRVKNMKETKFRAFALNLIFTINMILP